VIKIGRRGDSYDRFVAESNADLVVKHVYATDIRKAKATVEADLTRIHAMIEEQGGLDHLNTRICTAVYNNWRIMQIPAVQHALMGSREQVSQFLATFDPAQYSGDTGGTLLHDLVHGNFCSAAELAIECGANVSAQTDKANTPLMFAAEGGATRMCALLIKHGAALDLQNRKGETALHLAAKYGRAGVVRLLVDAGADSEILDNGNYTPAGLAKLNKIPGCRAVLEILDPNWPAEMQVAQRKSKKRESQCSCQ
jgi:hypothetical protein